MLDYWLNDIDGFLAQIAKASALSDEELVKELQESPDFCSYLAGTCAPGFQLYAKLWEADKSKPLQPFLQWNEKAELGIRQQRTEALSYWGVKLVKALNWMANTEPARNATEELKKEISQHKAEIDAKKRLERKERLLQFYASIPALYKTASLKDFGDSKLVKNLLGGMSAVIYGGNGIGKTHLGWAITRHWREEEQDKDPFAYFAPFSMLMAMISMLAANAKVSGPEIIEQNYLHKISHLIIDECDKTDMGDVAFRNFSHLIGRRYEEGLQTILICNADSEEKVREILGDSVFSRFRAKSWNADIIKVSGEDKRRTH